MVFNFREGDQISLLSDILIDYDMTVVDYPRNHEGYPLLQLEMINYILRSSDSWLSLGEKNVILMHCEKGGWPVLAFMLAGLLLYRKQNSGEQKTLEMVYKMAPKQIFSALSPVNARASQLRYLQYITGRDSRSDWPPPDAHLVVDCLLLHNLPLFDGGKGCRPVVRVYGQDPSEKSNRDPRLLLSTLMADEPAWLYPKEECLVVKLQLRCQVQGDVFLECFHLYDDLVTEELIFKIMFHTGFIQSNILALNAGDIDAPWSPKYQLPKDFKAEVLFGDINDAPPQITMELGVGDGYHDSDNEFYEVEEIFTPIPRSPERKAVLKIKIDQEDGVVENKTRDCTLHNGAPRWDLESELSDIAALTDTAFVGGNEKEASENLLLIKDILVTEVGSIKDRDIDEQAKESVGWNNEPSLGADTATTVSKQEFDFSAPTLGSESDISASKSTLLVDDIDHRQALETKSDVRVSENIVVVDMGSHKEASKLLSEAQADNVSEIAVSGAELAESITSISKNIVVDENKHIYALEKEMVVSAPALGADSGVIASRNIVLVDDMYHNEVSKTQTEARTLEKEMDISAPASGEESKAVMSRNISLIDNMDHIEASELQPEAQALEKEMEVSTPASCEESKTIMLRDIALIDNMYHIEASELQTEAQALEKEMEVSTPASCEESKTIMSRGIALIDNMYDIEASELQSEAQALGKEMDVSAPASGDESKTVTSRNISLIDNMYHTEASEIESEVQAQGKEMDVSAPASGDESITVMSRNIALIDDTYHIEASEIRSEVQALEKEMDVSAPASEINTSRNFVLPDGMYNKEVSDTQALEKEMVVISPALGAESGITLPRNIVQADNMDHKEVSKALEKEMVVIAPEFGAESGIIMPRNIVSADNMYHKEVLETRSETQVSEKEMDVNAPTSEVESIITSRNVILVDDKLYDEVLQTQSEAQTLEKEMYVSEPALRAEAGINMSRDDHLVDCVYDKTVSETQSEAQAPEKEMDVSAPVSGVESGTITSRNNGLTDSVYDKEVSEAQYVAQAPEKETDVSAPVSGVVTSRNFVLVDDMYHQEASKTQFEAQSTEKEMVVGALVSGTESVLDMSRNNILVDGTYFNEVLKTQSEANVPEKEMDVSAPISGAESGIFTSRNFILVDDMYHKEASGTQSEAQALEKEMNVCAPALGAETGVTIVKNIDLVDDVEYKEPLKTQSEKEADDGRNTQYLGAEFFTHAFKNISIDESNHVQVEEKEIDVSVPSSRAESDTSASKNIVLDDDMYRKEASEIAVDISASKNDSVVDIKEATETQSEVKANEGHDMQTSGAESVTHALKNVVVEDSNHTQALEMKMDMGAPPASGVSTSKNIILVDHEDHKHASEKDVDINASKHTEVVSTRIQKEASETQSDISVATNNVVIAEASAPKNITVVNDGSQIQHVKVEIQPKSVPSSSKPKQIKRNKWQEMAAKTITQQRVVSQWVPRVKPQAPEPAKPRATAYKWVPKGAATPSGDK